MASALFRSIRHFGARLRGVLPCGCALCGITGDHAVCDGCQKQFFSDSRPRCSRCAILRPDHSANASQCGACLRHPPAFDAAIAAADYAPPIDQLVLALKFGNQLAMAPLFADLLFRASRIMPAEDFPTVLTAVPLGAQRLRERGFNQALEIAKPLSRAMHIGLDSYLISRIRDTQPQSMLHPDERHGNIKQAFSVPAAALARMRGAHVGIVDDVMTTGETLNELAATLKRFGAARVTALVFARTQPK